MCFRSYPAQCQETHDLKQKGRRAEGYLANPLECARVEPVCKHRCPFLVPSIPCLTISLISTGQQFFKCVGSLLLLSATSFVQDLTHNFSTRATTLPNVATVSVSSVRQFKALMHRHNALTRHTLLSLSDWSLKESSDRWSSGTNVNRTSSLRQPEVQAVKTHEGEKTCNYSTGPTTFIPLLETHNPQEHTPSCHQSWTI
jgi:hypothetical protein